MPTKYDVQSARDNPDSYASYQAAQAASDWLRKKNAEAAAAKVNTLKYGTNEPVWQDKPKTNGNTSIIDPNANNQAKRDALMYGTGTPTWQSYQQPAVNAQQSAKPAAAATSPANSYTPATNVATPNTAIKTGSSYVYGASAKPSANNLPDYLKNDPSRYEIDANGDVWSWNIDHSQKSKLVGNGWNYDWNPNQQAVNGFFNSGTGAGNSNTAYWDDIKQKLSEGQSIYDVLPFDELVKRGLVNYWPTEENIFAYPELWGMFGYTPPEGYAPNSGMLADGVYGAAELAAQNLNWDNLGKNWYEQTGSVDPLAGLYTAGGWRGNGIGAWAPGGAFANGNASTVFSGTGADEAATFYGGLSGNDILSGGDGTNYGSVNLSGSAGGSAGGYNVPAASTNDPYAAVRAALAQQKQLAEQKLAEEEAAAGKDAYVTYRQNLRQLPAYLTAQGISGGASETTTADMQNAYLNSLAQLAAARVSGEADLGASYAGQLADVEAQAAQLAYQQQQDAIAKSQWEQQMAYQQQQDALAQRNYENEWNYQLAQDAASKAGSGSSGANSNSETGTSGMTAVTTPDEAIGNALVAGLINSTNPAEYMRSVEKTYKNMYPNQWKQLQAYYKKMQGDEVEYK